MHYHYLTLIFYFATLFSSFTDSALNSKGCELLKIECRKKDRVLVLKLDCYFVW